MGNGAKKPGWARFLAFAASLALLAAALAGCGAAGSGGAAAPAPGETKAVYHKISPQQAKSMMDAGKPYTLVDVRTDAEYKAQRIQGAVLIPSADIKTLAPAMLPDKNALIIVYCRSGVRSSGAAHALVDMGYANVYDMGGIMGWPYATVSG